MHWFIFNNKTWDTELSALKLWVAGFFCTAWPFLSIMDTGSPTSDGQMADHGGMIYDWMLGHGNTVSVPTFTL